MGLINQRKFKGGYSFKHYLGQAPALLKEAGIPSRAVVPLRQGFGAEVKAVVKKGEEVLAGQIIGRDDESISSPVHSPVTGIVSDIKRINFFKRDVSMVLISTTDDSSNFSRIKGHTPEWWKLHNEQIEELIYLSGASALDRQGIPTRFKSSIISSDEVNHLIIHGVGSEPYNISIDLLLAGKKLLHFFEGVKILKRILPNCQVHLALNFHKPKIIEQLKKLSHGLEWLDIFPLEPKFPQGYDEMLVPTILGQRFPYGYSAANIGAIVLNIQAVINVYEAVAEGKPLIERIIALCGPAFTENIHLKVRVGAPLHDIVTARLNPAYPSRTVLNSLLTGFCLNDFSLPVDKTFSQIISIPENKERRLFAFARAGLKQDSYSRTFLAKWLPVAPKDVDTNQHGEERPCISCGFCEEACPVRIIPHLLSKYVKLGVIDETLMNYDIFHCIECGLCSFVCPSKIPLLKIIRDGQEKLTIQGCDRTQCILPRFNLKGIEEYRGATKL